MRLYYICLLLLLSLGIKAQVITSNPAIPIDSKEVTITFYADKGSAGLKDYTGDVYAHTGVITDKSSGDGDWKYAPSWGDNAAKYKMTRVGANEYTLTLTPTIRDYYAVPAGEIIQKMAFVFRSHDNAKEGKDTGGKDIFVDVSAEELAVSILSPQNSSLHDKGTAVEVKVDALLNDNIELFVNGVSVATSTTQSLTHTITNVTLDKYELKAVATKGAEKVEATSQFFVKGDVVIAPRPANLKRGVNVIDASTATVVLFAPNKAFAYLMGDFNNWQPTNAAMMKKDGDYFWLTLTGLDATKEYAYQFWFDGGLKVADPYTNKILDPWNDKYIPERIYPNLKAYPVGKTDEIVSVLTTATETFNWEVQNFKVPEPEKLVVYEILIRDFTKNQDIKTITDTLSYLKRLGVNAIELMPFNEFEGNDSWGYNPSFYFATDKAYGTVEDYKTFIDECHKAGMAVIMDMVFNHSYGQSPFARMYLGENGKPLNSPWYNTEHNMAEPAAQWGFDFNHESIHTKHLVDSVCGYWIDEYKIDGFRFDFTKGFTNTKYGVGDWASAYDAPRIAILKRMATEIWKKKSDAVVMFEHLSDNQEEKELSNHGNGILFWGNANHSYNEATMGYNENNKSDLKWSSYQERGWSKPHIVNYMESHDEERLMYKNIQYGNVEGDYSTKDINTALKRMEAATVFFIPVPGPKMIWQFGELGFDMSINRCTDGTVSGDCRLAQKPPTWEYQDEANRKQLFSVYQRLIEIKKKEPVFATADYTMDVAGAVKQMSLNLAGSDVRIIGNFGVTQASAKAHFSTTGKWYDILGSDSIMVTDKQMSFSLKPGQYAMFSQKKLSGFDTYTSVEDNVVVQQQVMVTPNPFSSEVNIKTNLTGLIEYELYSITGAKVKQGILRQNEVSLNWSGLPKGHYVLRLRNDAHVVIKKLVKQ